MKRFVCVLILAIVLSSLAIGCESVEDPRQNKQYSNAIMDAVKDPTPKDISVNLQAIVGSNSYGSRLE